MKQRDLIKTLNKFKAISPDRDWARKSLFSIQQYPQIIETESFSSDLNLITENGLSFFQFLKTSLNYAWLTGLAVVAVVGAYLATKELSPYFLPGLNQSGIVAEASLINKTIDIHIAQLESFKETKNQTTVALDQVSKNTMNHLNETIISSEVKKIDSSTSVNTMKVSDVNNQINDILNAISK